MSSDTLHSTADVARLIGCDPSRVKRLAVRLGIGRKVGQRSWVFTAADVDRLRPHAVGKSGRPKKRKEPAYM